MQYVTRETRPVITIEHNKQNKVFGFRMLNIRSLNHKLHLMNRTSSMSFKFLGSLNKKYNTQHILG